MQANGARIIWIVVGAAILTLGVGFLGLPVLIGMFGAPIDMRLAFLLAAAADVVLVGVYAAGILVARRGPTGRLRAVPPAIAAGILLAGFAVASQLIVAVSAR